MSGSFIKETVASFLTASPPKNPESTAFRIFSFVSTGHNINCVHTQHHLSFSSTSFRRMRTQMNDVALGANDVLRNDVPLRVNDVALRANGFYRTSSTPPPRVLDIKCTQKYAILLQKSSKCANIRLTNFLARIFKCYL